MAECSAAVSQQASEINLMNLKAILERFASLMAQGAEDNQSDARAWASYRLRVANNASTIDNFIHAGLIASQATAATENEQTVSPAGTAASETAKGAVADAGAGIATAAEGIATANQAIADALATFVAGVNTNAANLAAALGAVLVTAAGGASTPSQTQAKPTAAPSPAAL